MKPSFGFNHLPPPEEQILAAFGARLIDTTDERMTILHDRKSLVFREDLASAARRALAPQKPLERALKLLKAEISPRSQSDRIYVIRDTFNDGLHATTHASQNSSHGYVYLTIWVTEQQQEVPEGTVELTTTKRNH